MSFVHGTGPLAAGAAGRFNVKLPRPEPLLYFEPTPVRVRALFGGETFVDSRRAMLLHESDRLPVYWFPREDLRDDLLAASERRESVRGKGEIAFAHVRAARRIAHDAVRIVEAPDPRAPFLAGHASVQWDAMDEWFGEDRAAVRPSA